jgi:large subunit ribosomal protein L18
MLRQQRQRKNRLTRRRKRVKKRIFGTTERPRLCVYRSLTQIYAQLVDDQGGRTLTGASSLAPEIKSQVKPEDSKSSVSKKVGLRLAEKAKEKGINRVVFDRNRYSYHGRIKSLAQGARDGGLGF